MIFPCSCPYKEAFPAMFRDTSFNRNRRPCPASALRRPQNAALFALGGGFMSLQFLPRDCNLWRRNMDATFSLDPSTVAVFCYSKMAGVSNLGPRREFDSLWLVKLQFPGVRVDQRKTWGMVNLKGKLTVTRQDPTNKPQFAVQVWVYGIHLPT